MLLLIALFGFVIGLQWIIVFKDDRAELGAQVGSPQHMDYPRTRRPYSPRIVMQCVSMIINWP